ncbi:MAG: three-Cys-motif partner protein TcmP, partial [Verrucomicrobiota bacterium]
SERMKPFSGTPEVQIHLVHDQFANGMIRLKDQMPDLFQQTCPKFFFIDPFGAKGVPFATVSDILSNRFTEVLINLDADGIARILRANTSAVYERLLTEIFGDDSWRKISRSSSFSQQCREVLNLYKGNLRKHAQYIFSFEMKTSESALNYFLVFASQHPRGLEKMKEAMKKIDQDGSYRFSDTSVGQTIMFRGDDSNLFSKAMKMHFAGRKVSFEELRDFALNETPFLNPKQMLKQLEADGFITVESSDQRRKGTFNEAKIRSIEFRPET